MAEAEKPSQVKLVIGAITSSEGVLIKTKSLLKRKFGAIDFESPMIPFIHTDYYAAEMGESLRRQFLSFQQLIDPNQLPEIKLYTNRLESHFSSAKINLHERLI
ncbi:MAG: DUF4416 family protein [Candidatus Omnitrophica bacterium]|nr:DUF4416 family protein [Candidatus Omnitrophota bacterium]